MNKMIHALEMEEEDDHHHALGYQDDDDHDDDDAVHLLSGIKNGHTGNGVKSTREALNRQQQQQQSQSRTTIANSSRYSKMLLLGLFGLLILYGITYKETVQEPTTFIPKNDNDDDTFAGDTVPVPATTTTTTIAPITMAMNHPDETPAVAPSATTTSAPAATMKNPDVTSTPVVVSSPVSTPTTLDTSSTTTTTNTAPTSKGYMYSQLSAIVPDPDHVPVNDTTQAALITKWGKWKFFDGEETNRPKDDYCGAYENRDIPGDQFPAGSWQLDAVYVNHIINDASNLIARAKEAIFTEYGHGKPLRPEQLAERLRMFHWERLKTISPETIPDTFGKKGSHGIGGWITEKGWDGLVRRLLHAMMTNDDFTVVLGGHSAAAGHGNHFHQSYLMQFHKIMAPIMARLGVKLRTHNFSQGGLGTLQNAMGMKSLYGAGIDILLWDSGMTETDASHIDLYARQGLVSGTKVPLLLGGNWAVMKFLYDNAEADVGVYGNGMDGIEAIQNETHALQVPYAARYLKCSHDRQDICDGAPRFCATCWNERPNYVKEDHFWNIAAKPGSQVKWHPGWRSHQLQGRVLAFTVLDALSEAIQIFSDNTMGGPPLDEDWWHMTDYYQNIRTKVMQLQSTGECAKIQKDLPIRLCTTALEARSLYTPRMNPLETSLTTLIQPAEDGYVPKNVDIVEYDGPETHNKCYDIPEGEIDTLAIISNRRRLQQNEIPDDNNNDYDSDANETTIVKSASAIKNVRNETIDDTLSRNRLDAQNYSSTSTNRQRQLADDAIVPGKGWILLAEPPGICDGTYDSICGRAKWTECPAIGHHDGRGILQGDEYSGWIVFTLPRVKEGLILLKVITYVDPKANWKTKGWTSVNNEKRDRRLRRINQQQLEPTGSIVVQEQYDENDPEQYVGQDGEPLVQYESNRNSRRKLDTIEKYPDSTIFEYAIDGVIKSLTKDELIKFVKKPQRVVEMVTLLDDASYTPKENVKVAVRMRNCGHDCAIGISHIYWA